MSDDHAAGDRYLAPTNLDTSLMFDRDDPVDPDHSVTCAVCGDLVDERESVECTREHLASTPELVFDSIAGVAVVAAVIARFGEGEIHQGCYNAVRAQIIPGGGMR